MNNISDHITSLLVQKDDRAIDLIYDHYSANLYGYVLRMVDDEELASDIIQESFVKIWKNATKFNPQKAKLFTWMLNICRNLAIDKLRSRKRNLTVDIQTEGSNVYKYGLSYLNVEHLDLKEKIEALDVKYKDVIEVLFFKGMTQREASEYLDIPLGTVKTRLKIALRELQKIFKYKRESLGILLPILWMIK